MLFLSFFTAQQLILQVINLILCTLFMKVVIVTYIVILVIVTGSYNTYIY